MKPSVPIASFLAALALGACDRPSPTVVPVLPPATAPSARKDAGPSPVAHATVDAGHATSPADAGLPSGPIANEARVKRYPKEIAVPSSPPVVLTAQSGVGVYLTAPGSRNMVTRLRPGLPVVLIADLDASDAEALVVFADPADGSQRLEGWVDRGALAPRGTVEEARAWRAAVDAGKTPRLLVCGPDEELVAEERASPTCLRSCEQSACPAGFSCGSVPSYSALTGEGNPRAQVSVCSGP